MSIGRYKAQRFYAASRMMASILLCGCFAWTQASAGASADEGARVGEDNREYCENVLKNLIPQHVMSKFYDKKLSVPPNLNPNLNAHELGNRGFQLWYTDFRFEEPGPEYTIATGYFLNQILKDTLYIKEVDIFMSYSHFFHGRGWEENGYPRSRGGGNPPDKWEHLLASVILYMRYGKIVDNAYLSKDHDKIWPVIAEYGIGDSDIERWYECQSCRGAPSFTYSMSQDLRKLRLAKIDDKLIVITTRPVVIMAELNFNKVKYTLCPPGIDRTMAYDIVGGDRETILSRQALKLNKD